MKQIAAVIMLVILATRASASTLSNAPERQLSLEEAIAMSLEHNEGIVIQRETLAAAEAAELGAHGAYDPDLGAYADYNHTQTPVNSPLSGAPAGRAAPTYEAGTGGVSVRQLLPTGGSVAVRMDASRQTTDGTFVLLSPAYQTRAGIEFRQPLLRGRSIDSARLGLRVSAAFRAQSNASLRRQVTDTVALVEQAYWSLVSALRTMVVRQEAVEWAQQQLEETRARVDGGAAPKNEISQPTAELERRRGELFASREDASRAENALKRLILGAEDTGMWASRLVPADDPQVEMARVDVEDALARALAQRPEVDESKSEIERRRIEATFAQDTIKPGLDAYVSYDRFGLAGSVVDQDPNSQFQVTIPHWIRGGLGSSLDTLHDGRYDDTRAGVVLSIPIGNRFAKGAAGVAKSAERQAQAGLSGLQKQIMAEVLDATAAVDTAAQRVEAARAAREAADVQWTSERDRYGVGLSTNFLVLTRQNDLSRARLDEITALTDYRKARTEIARATGALLDERHIKVESTPPTREEN